MNSSHPEPDLRQWLSDLTDGRLDAASVAHGCAGWAHDAQARRTWHAYQLIGDVLRSDELARDPCRDRAFLVTLRTRLRAEPVTFAPGPVAAPAAHGRRSGFAAARRARRWGRPIAVAAGFVAVAGVVVVLRTPASDADGATPALAIAPAGSVRPATAGAPLGAAGIRVGAGVAAAAPDASGSTPRAEMLRDARLDQYLSAHREALAGSPAALPGGALRSVEFGAAAGR